MMNIDWNLKFLDQASNDDLLTLCDIVTKERDGSFRTTETLSATHSYNMNYPDNIRRMLPDLIHEFRLFGGNSVLNFFRGDGPEYSEILRDVAKKCKVAFDIAADEDERVEQLMLGTLIKNALKDASDDELIQITRELDVSIHEFSRRKTIFALEKLWRSGKIEGFMLMASVATSVLGRLTGLTINTVVSGVTLTGLTALMLGPIGLILESLYFAMDFAGPAYRVTIPAVIQIAYIRQKIRFNLTH